MQLTAAFQAAFARMWNIITEPAQTIPDGPERRQARLLAGVLIPIIVVWLVGLQTMHLPALRIENSFEIVFFLVAYILSRTRFHRVGAIIMVVTMLASTYSGMAVAGDSQVELAAEILSIPWLAVLLAGSLFSASITFVIGFIGLGLIVASPYVFPALTPEIVNPLSSLQLALSALAVATSATITANMKQIERQSAELEQTVAKLSKANRQLEQARDEAEEANRLKSQFLATMSHELRTPLHAINGYAQITLEGIAGELNENQRENLERVLINGQHLLALITDILDLSKMEFGNISLRDKPFALHLWIDEVVGQSRALAREKGLQLEAVIDERMPDTIVGDRARLTQIALNLVGNALKFTDEGEVRLKVHRQGTERWELMVIDTGIGIPEHAQEFIFDEFRQVDSSTQRVHGGVGLGLTIVRELVSLMGGTVQVKSKPGHGSTFVVSLPLVTGGSDPDRT